MKDKVYEIKMRCLIQNLLHTADFLKDPNCRILFLILIENFKKLLKKEVQMKPYKFKILIPCLILFFIIIESKCGNIRGNFVGMWVYKEGDEVKSRLEIEKDGTYEYWHAVGFGFFRDEYTVKGTWQATKDKDGEWITFIL